MKSFLYKDLIDVSEFKDEGEKLRKNYNLMPQGIEIKYKKTRGPPSIILTNNFCL